MTTSTPPRDSAPRPPWYAGLALATQFLTILPITPPAHWSDAPAAAPPTADAAPPTATPPDLAHALPAFPLVGAALGVTLAAANWALTWLFPLSVRAVLLLAASALLTGLLHLDGFVDCCDALLGARSVERRLVILRDSRVGAYGALGAALLMLARFAALSALLARPTALAALTIILAPLFGRWAIVYAVTRYPYARAAGLGALFRQRRGRLTQATGATLILLTVLAVLAALFTSTTSTSPFPPRLSSYAAAEFVFWLALAALLWLLAALTTLTAARWASRRLGGALTGDTYGAINELIELATLLLAPPSALVLTALITALAHAP